MNRRTGSIVIVLGVWSVLGGAHVLAQTQTWTTTLDSQQGTFINLNDATVANRLQINTWQEIKFSDPPVLPYLWVALSKRGTVVRIATTTFDPLTGNTVSIGDILGEYLSGLTNPDGSLLCGRNPSRTTVDFDGNVWAGNRDDTDGKGSVVKIGSGFAFQWKDYDNDTILDTSAGLGLAGDEIANRLDPTCRGHVYTYRTFVGRRSVESGS